MNALLDGKVAIVTGASRRRGIGRASALTLARMGANVVVTHTGTESPGGRSEEETKIGWRGADSVAEEIESLGKGAASLVVDVTNADSVQSMVGATISRFGRVDILVANAAAPREDCQVVDLPEDVWDQIIAVNLKGVFLCCKAVGRQLVEQGERGRIIVVSSMSGKRGQPRRAAYCASKFGQIGLVQALALELARNNITVNAVLPGMVDTSRSNYGELLRSQVSGRSVEDIQSDRLKQIPLGRMATPQDIANMVGFLASPDADYVTGQSLLVNGGSGM